MKMLDEAGEASAQAKQMGLISKGWGRWADPKTGKVTHKTDNNRLVAVDPKQQEPDLDTVAKDIKRSGDSGNVGMGSPPDKKALANKFLKTGDKANKLKRAQSLRQAWKQKGNAEAQATFARDFPKQYALDVASQQGKDLASKISRDMKGKGPEWKKQAAAQLKQHKARVEKIRSMDDDTQFRGDMDQRRSELDKLRGDGDDTVSGMSGKRARIVRR
jgi:hypothetical protein